MVDQRQTIVVLGATGKQGGSVVEVFLQQASKYHVRGLTRNLESHKAAVLTAKGVEMVTADLNDVDSLEIAFRGAHIIYAMTDFWQEMSFEVEYKQGRDIANIAATIPQLGHFIWATLPDGLAISEGRYRNIHHWQSKAAVTDYIRASKPDLWAKTVAILFPNYFENCKDNARAYLPVKQKDGSYLRSFPLGPNTGLPNVGITDTGKLVKRVVESGLEFHGKTISFYSQNVSEKTKHEILGKFHSINVRYKQMSEQEFRTALEAKMPANIALDFTEQLMIFESCGNIYDRPEFVQVNQIKGLKLQTWEEYIKTADLLSHMVNTEE